jgi:ribosomal-protein-alanine N-acetyltransferase
MVAQNDSVTGIYRAIVMDGQPIGSISVEQKDDVFRIDGEIGFMLHGNYCNKGIMTETVRQMCTVAFRDLSIERITANVFHPNTASIQVLRKNGFVHEATLRNAVIKNNEIYDLCIFGLKKL